MFCIVTFPFSALKGPDMRDDLFLQPCPKTKSLDFFWELFLNQASSDIFFFFQLFSLQYKMSVNLQEQESKAE